MPDPKRQMTLPEATNKLWARLEVMGDCIPVSCFPDAGILTFILDNGFQEAIVDMEITIHDTTPANFRKLS